MQLLLALQLEGPNGSKYVAHDWQLSWLGSQKIWLEPSHERLRENAGCCIPLSCSGFSRVYGQKIEEE